MSFCLSAGLILKRALKIECRAGRSLLLPIRHTGQPFRPKIAQWLGFAVRVIELCESQVRAREDSQRVRRGPLGPLSHGSVWCSAPIPMIRSSPSARLHVPEQFTLSSFDRTVDPRLQSPHVYSVDIESNGANLLSHTGPFIY